MKFYQIQRQAGIGVLGTERDVRELFSGPTTQAALDLFFEHSRPGDVFDGLYRDELDKRGEPIMYMDGVVFVVALGRRFTPRFEVSPNKIGRLQERVSVSFHGAQRALVDADGDVEGAVTLLLGLGHA